MVRHRRRKGHRNKKRDNPRNRKKKPTRKSPKGFSSSTRMLIHARANEKCQFPDCKNNGKSCHHIVPKSYCSDVLHWQESKINALNNGILLCNFHHSRMHRGRTWESYIRIFKRIIANSTYN